MGYFKLVQKYQSRQSQVRGITAKFTLAMLIVIGDYHIGYFYFVYCLLILVLQQMSFDMYYACCCLAD